MHKFWNTFQLHCTAHTPTPSVVNDERSDGDSRDREEGEREREKGEGERGGGERERMERERERTWEVSDLGFPVWHREHRSHVRRTPL